MKKRKELKKVVAASAPSDGPSDGEEQENLEEEVGKVAAEEEWERR